MMARRQVRGAMGKKGLRRPPGVVVTLGDYDFLRTGVIVNTERTELHLSATSDTLFDGSIVAGFS